MQVFTCNLSVSKKLITLEEFIIQSQNRFPRATGELSQLLRDIGLAAKIISREVNKAGITNLLGLDGQSRIMEIKAESIHQRAPIFIGSSENVKRVKSFLEKHKATPEEYQA